MQTVIQGSESVLKLFSPINRNVERVAPSSYLIFCKTDEGLLLHNTVTGELVILSSEEEKLFHRLPGQATPELAELIRHRFAVPEATREEKTVEQLRAIFLKRREAEDVITRYIILPTTGCNARCFYCYQNGIQHVNMSEETADRLADFISAHHGGKTIGLSWFGGEPTLGRARIDQICRRLDERQIEYHSDMVSNGYLFDQKLVKHAKTAWKLKNIQITLDGTEQVYNETKAYVGISDSAYQRVVRNIGYFLEEKIRVDVRLNYDAHNAQDLENLILELADRFKGDDHLIVYVRQLNENVGFSPIQHKDGDLARLTKRLIGLMDLLEENGWPQYRQTELPCLKPCACMADDPCSIQCTPDGILGKCEDQIFTHTVGTLEEGVTDEAEVRWWRERTVYDGCKTCPLLPSCTHMLKHCPTRKKECSSDEKERRLSMCREIMVKKYMDWKAERDSNVQ